MVREPEPHPPAEPSLPVSGPQGATLVQTVLDSLTYPLYVIDVADYHVRLANRTARKTCGGAATTCHALTHREEVPCHTEGCPCPIEIIKETGKPTVVEHVHYDAAGVPKNVEVHAFPIFDDAGRVVQIIEYCVDITDRKQVEEALRDLNVTLETKVAQRTAELEHRAHQLQRLTLELSQAEDQERRRLAEILHDDLQQVLAAAKFHLGFLKSRAKQDPSQQVVAGQIEQMLKEAIDKSRSLSHELSPAVLHHSDFAGALRWLSEQIQTKHGLVVHMEAPGRVNLESDVLRAFLFRAAQELLFNVVKHARVREARVRVRRQGRYLGLAIADRGRGFDPHELGETAGFGLLSIRERVELLGGRMKIKSAKGKGSTFYIIIPENGMAEDRGPRTDDGRPRAEDRLPSSVLGPASCGSRLRVLLVDDHEIVREGLASLLSEEPALEVVGQAADGREAINQAYRLRPDVVVMDVAMPLIDGESATRQIKLHLPQTRVIALSMYEETETRERMCQAGAESYVLKTAPSEELLAAIRGKEADS